MKTKKSKKKNIKKQKEMAVQKPVETIEDVIKVAEKNVITEDKKEVALSDETKKTIKEWLVYLGQALVTAIISKISTKK